VRVALALHHVRPTGGQDRYALELARRLAASCDLDLITIRAEGELPERVRVRRVTAPDRPLLLTAPLFRQRAEALIAQGRYDVVHAVGGALPGASVITAQFCHAAWREVNRASGLYQRLVTCQAVAHERLAYRHRALKAVIAVSRRTAGEIERHYGPLRAPVTVIPNAVDPARFAPPPAGRRQAAQPRVLFVGAYARKGLDTAIRALGMVTGPARLTAVGAGDRPRYAALAKELGLEGRVELLPPTADVASHYAAADAFLFPTRYEPFGMVIAEAMACGLPVVASAVAGAAELIEDGVSGILVEDPEDAAAFARALDRVLADGAARRSMGAAARAAVASLTWERVAEQTLAVYRSAR
jgi:UDP-glucose:(heptosyl)LPS alpha-1,3-glucosyltransferase